MNFTWILLASIGWALGLAFVLGLIRMFGDPGRAARHQSKGLEPYSDVTITRTGNG